MSDISITTPPGFDELPKAEQVRYLQALWDQISEHPNEIPVPESHLQLAEERLRRYRKETSSAQPAFDVIDRLSQDRKVKHYRLEAESAVEFDIESAFSWYEAEEPGLGLEFLEQLRLVYRRILENRLDMRNNAQVFDAG